MPENTTATKTALETVPSPIKISGPLGIFERFDRMYDAIARRAFELFEGNGKQSGRELEDWFTAESELLHPVNLNVSENEKSVTVQAEVPGFTEKDLDIRVEAGRLTITGKRETTKKQEKGKTVHEEMRSDEILRVIALPAEIDPNKVTATLKNGMLEVQLPKTAKSGATQVSVKAA